MGEHFKFNFWKATLKIKRRALGQGHGQREKFTLYRILAMQGSVYSFFAGRVGRGLL